MADLLKENYILGLSVSDKEYVFWRIARTNSFSIIYNFYTEQNLAPLSAVNTNMMGYSPYFTQVITFPIPSSYINTNIQDMFKITNNNEIWQIFVGLSPSYLRVVPIQPASGAPIYHLDQNINPLKTFMEIGYDGFMSPFDNPSNISEAYILSGLNIGFVLQNPVSIPISPVFNFLINRMIVEPITDPATAKAIIDGKIPAHLVSTSSIRQDIKNSINWSNYPNAMVFNVTEKTGKLIGGR
jgi:hypothetical protein